MTAAVDEQATGAEPTPRQRARAGSEAALLISASSLAAACAVAAGGFGLLAVVAISAAIAGGAAAWRWRAWLRPLRPGASFGDQDSTLGAGALAHSSRWVDLALIGLSAATAGGVAVVAGSLGPQGSILACAVVGAAVAAVVWRRELVGVAFGSGERLDAPAWRRRTRLAVPDVLRRPPRVSRLFAAVVSLVLVTGGAAAAWMAASLGIKGAALLVTGLGLLAMLTFVRDREDLMLFVLVCSLVLFLHKSVGPLYPVNSGAPALYITSLGLILVVLYALWAMSGRLGPQLASARRRPALLVPLVGVLLMLPSLLVARDLMMAGAELARMGWMYLLFVYITVRVRRIAQIWAILAGLAVVAVIELVVVALQFKTGGVLGLGFLGVPMELGERVVDGGTLGRPFGTLVHPVFLGALMASLGLLALSIGLALRDTRSKAISLALVPVCVVTLLFSQARVALVVFCAVAVGVLVSSTIQGRMARRSLARVVLAGAVVALLASPYLWSQYREHFRSDHVSVEVQSRTELNGVALEMMADHPVLGVGLNHFQDAMGPYDRYGLLFAGNPVHNLYLLQASETGYVGLLGLLLVGIAFLRTSLRLARVDDPLLGGLGSGISAVFVFFALEELAGFSLRQEIPLALWWILAGLAVAGLAIAERPKHHPRHLARRSPRPRPAAPAHGRRPATAGSARRTTRPLSRRRRRRGVRARIALATAVAGAALLPAGTGAGAGNDSLRDARIVFAAVDAMAGGEQAIFTAAADGSGITRASPDDGAFYDFPTWAMGGTKIVYSRREGGSATPENIWMADPDGSHRVQLTFSPWRNHQPKVSADGTSLVFSGFVPGTRLVALYELDLATLQVRNLSAVHSTSVVADADPRFTPDGSIVFARSRSDEGEAKTQAWLMAADGTGRRQITKDAFYDVDPMLSPDQRSVAYASYRGRGTPQDEGSPTLAKHRDFHIVVRDLASGRERTLTGGQNCLERPASEACTPDEASGYVPVWTPDGTELGFVAPLSREQVCICTIGVDGSEPKVLLSAPGLQINYFDWIVPGQAPPTAVLEPGTDRPDGRLLVSGTETVDPDDPARSVPFLAASGGDWWDRQPIPVPMAARSVRWGPGRETIALVTTAPVDPLEPPHHTGPRRVHFTLPELALAFRPTVDRPEVAGLQVYLVDGDGLARQVTDPWMEDPLDALAEGDARGNIDPDLSPDGRYLVVTNVSATTAESFILRLDLETSEVVNLTNATSGALPVDDAQPRYSPDGRSIAFTSSFEGQSGVYLMDADTGRSVRRLSDEDSFDVSPAWSPDGRYVVYSSYGGDMIPLLESLSMPEELRRIPLVGWSLVRVDVVTGERRVLTDEAASPALSPVWSPDGEEIAFISVTDGFQPDLYVVPASGGEARLIQITGLLQELSVDWR